MIDPDKGEEGRINGHAELGGKQQAFSGVDGDAPVKRHSKRKRRHSKRATGPYFSYARERDGLALVRLAPTPELGAPTEKPHAAAPAAAAVDLVAIREALYRQIKDELRQEIDTLAKVRSDEGRAALESQFGRDLQEKLLALRAELSTVGASKHTADAAIQALESRLQRLHIEIHETARNAARDQVVAVGQEQWARVDRQNKSNFMSGFWGVVVAVTGIGSLIFIAGDQFFDGKIDARLQKNTEKIATFEKTWKEAAASVDLVEEKTRQSYISIESTRQSVAELLKRLSDGDGAVELGKAISEFKALKPVVSDVLRGAQAIQLMGNRVTTVEAKLAALNGSASTSLAIDFLEQKRTAADAISVKATCPNNSWALSGSCDASAPEGSSTEPFFLVQVGATNRSTWACMWNRKFKSATARVVCGAKTKLARQPL